MIKANLTEKNRVRPKHINFPTLKKLTVPVISSIHTPTKNN